MPEFYKKRAKATLSGGFCPIINYLLYYRFILTDYRQ